MGRFNYTNRKSEGVKLGQIVAKDIRKQVSKKSTPAQREKVPLELNLHGKRLTDEGLSELVAGLRQGAPHVRLEELDLSENGLSWASLRSLATVVRVAGHELRTLDLSGNEISVPSDDALKAWETFVESLENCRQLRKLDFTGNKFSDPRAFEVLLRAYSRYSPRNADMNGCGNTHGTSAGLLEEKGATNTLATRTIGPLQPEALWLKPPTARPQYGLRSVPYLIFRNCAMSDCGALHLSYILAEHCYPEQLLNTLRVSGTAIHRAGDDFQLKNRLGIDYSENNGLSRPAFKLLEQASLVRQNNVVGTAEVYSTLAENISPSFAHENQEGRKASINDRLRGLPNVTVASETASDLGSSRKKIQRATIDDFGASKVELWGAALRMLVYARVMLLREHIYDSVPIYKMTLRTGASHTNTTSSTNLMTHTYASLLVAAPTGANDSVFSVTSATIKPVPPVVKDHTLDSCRADVGEPGLLFQKKVAKFRANLLPGTIDRYGREVRDPTLPGKLPLQLWRNIVAEAAGARCILSKVQLGSVVRYAADRNNLLSERQILCKDKSYQIWSVLESLKCLEYEVEL